MEPCPCGLDAAYDTCCGPIIRGEKAAETAEQLMRARYSAYAKVETDFLKESIHPDKRHTHDERQTKNWAAKSEWFNLEVVRTDKGGEGDETGQVEFIANYAVKGEKARHHELASFVKVEGAWYFDDGVGVVPETVVRQGPKVGRNDPCPCGSGKKFKKCCG
ncbi:YchJ family protein [Desulfoluna butyratoxydans]|uniref:Sec-c motif n=1 Tax=Desulfoluna butyratoxydans TaxID=231438 RepID=A0A4U8YNB1_9BACT|nr:YchJ family protein [Desulfoluna butyratoxydans]VFQ45566.1 sec-c motif [Desulfoluna butyratoxydans]